MNKTEFIENNKYLRKWFQNLKKEDIDFFIAVGKGEIDSHSPNCEIMFKQILRRMTAWFTLRESRGLLKAFKTLQKLPN